MLMLRKYSLFETLILNPKINEMRTILFMCLTAFGILLSQSTIAQTKTVTGYVVDASTKEALPGVNVVVKTTTRGAITDVNGLYSLNVSPGQILVFTSIGYVAQEVAVGEVNKYDVILSPDVKMVDEVVVTAEFGMKRVARTIGSSVQNIKASDIIESGRDNFITALQGRVAGMNVGQSSGAPGASTTVILRSITSISGNNQPLYVVDGIPMNNSTFDPASFADAGANYSVRNLDFSSRGNDFNPEDIESMTILKGAAAAALYGSDASNGAIIITTKKGSAGKGKITYGNSFRWDNAYGYPEMQTKYANGAYGTTNYFYTSRYGGLYPEGTKLYDNLASLIQTGFTSRHDISIEGGTDKISLRASARKLNSTGVIKTSGSDNLNLSLSGKAEINRWLSIEASMQYANTNTSKVPYGTDGPLYMATLWPITDNMANYLDEDGSHMRMPDLYTDTDLLNPLFGLYKNKLKDQSDRVLSIASINITPVKNTFIRMQMGWDFGMQTFITSKHPYYFNNSAGIGVYNIAKRNFSDPSLNLLTGYSNEFFNKKFTFSAQFGYHQLENGVTQLASTGSKYAVVDLQSINNVDPLTISSSQRTTKRRIQALSAQVELGYKSMAFLTFRARNDWSSTLPTNNNSYFYPAIEGSYIVTELPFMKNIVQVNYLKLRGSIAQVGKDAGPLEIDPQLEPTLLTGGGYKYGYTGPNKNLKPEMNTSKEIGFEGRFLKNRINTDFTYYWTRCEDQIVKGFRLSYATGFVLNNMNVGSFKTSGWEWHIDGDIISRANSLRWNVGFNASHTNSKVVYLPKNVTEYYNAYTWNSGNIRNGIMVGSPITALTGLAYTRNTAGEILINPTTGIPIINSTWSVIGDREPKLRFGITSALSYKNMRISVMFAGRYKATVVNGTKRTLMTNGLSKESVKLRESGPVIFNGVLQDGNEEAANPTKNNIAVDYSTYGASIFTGYDEDWVEKGINYLRLQELRFSYNLPDNWLARMPFSQANIYVAGNDLLTWTNYSGIDAVGNTVSAAAGGSGGEGMDVWSLPNPRGFSFGITVTFK
jgi:TonB-linked SusC/RagA family outer membrane protein